MDALCEPTCGATPRLTRSVLLLVPTISSFDVLYFMHSSPCSFLRRFQCYQKSDFNGGVKCPDDQGFSTFESSRRQFDLQMNSRYKKMYIKTGLFV